MERTKLLTVAVIGLLVLNLVTIGFLFLKSGQPSQTDQQYSSSPDGKGPARLIIARLHFNSQQQEQYLEMVRQHHQQTQRLNEASIRLFQAYYSLLIMANPDDSRATVLVQQIADNQRQIAKLNFAHFHQIKLLCHPGQQADFAQLVGDLARLFGRQQRPPRAGNDSPPEGHPDGPSGNFPPHP